MTRVRPLIFAVLYFLSSSVISEITEDDKVLVLTEENFKEALETYPMMLVEFYAPWCGHCKKLAPEYWAAAQNLAHANSPVRLGKVDATEQKELAKEYGVKGYPTLKFIKNGNVIDYAGGRTEDTIVAWVNKKAGDPAKVLDDAETAQALVEDNKVVVIGFYKDLESDDAKEFVQVADKLNEQVFGITSNEELFKKYEITGEKGVVLFKKFDEGKAVFDGEYNVEDLENWIEANSLPLVVEFNPDSARVLFGQGEKEIFFIFHSETDEGMEKRLEDMRKISKDNRGVLTFVSVNIDPAPHKKITEYFGVGEDEAPTFRIAKIGPQSEKYKPEENNFSDEYVRDFVKKYKDGELKPHLKAEKLPEDWDSKPVKILTASNFETVAYNTEKDVFVEFYAPWCGHCKKLTPIWDELAEKLEDDDSIVIAKLDATANEIPELQIRGFPTLKLFKKGDNTVRDFNGQRELNDLLKFVKPEAVIEEEKEEDTPEKKDEL